LPVKKGLLSHSRGPHPCHVTRSDAPAEEVAAERARVATEVAGARRLARIAQGTTGRSMQNIIGFVGVQ
jgi:hypothetical protein